MKWTIGAFAVFGLVGAFLYLVLFGGAGTAIVPASIGGAVASLLPERQRVRAALRAAAESYGLNPDWVEAIGYVESRWKLDAVGDGGRSVGPTQIQRATLHANGFVGTGDELLTDENLAADWTARLMIAGAKNAQGQTLRATPLTLEDLAAWWNAGKQSMNDVPGNNTARTDYAPKLADAVASIEGGGFA